MSELIHARPNMMFMARNTQGDGEEGIEDIYDSMESLRDQHQDYVGREESSNTLGTVKSQQPDPVSPPLCPIRAVVVLLVLLSVALLAGLLRFAVQHKTVMEKNVSMDRDMELLHQRLKNMTEQHKTVMEKTVSLDRDMELLHQRLKNMTEQHKTVMEKTVSLDRDMELLHQRLKNVTEQRDSLLCKPDCPSGWDKFGCKCYKFSNVGKSWKKSRELCVSKGADLVVVDSKEELDFISRTGKPSGGKDKNCLRRYAENTDIKWTDGSCEGQRRVLCEYNLIK
ncbi:unnamed protein product [Arctogadus glacialis]